MFNSYLANGRKESAPSDQALCVGNGFIFHSVNRALQVFEDAVVKTELTPVISLKTFFERSPSESKLFDPACYHDNESNHWFFLVAENQKKNLGGHRPTLMWQ